jgi:hypothetical protein
MDVWDVLVVVSRWYGGVKLGPDRFALHSAAGSGWSWADCCRFRLINAAAREALVMGGFASIEEGEKARGKSKKGKNVKAA